MISVLVTVLPVFLVLATGYASVRLGWLNAEISTNLNQFAIRLAIPMLLFRAMYQLDFGSAFHLPMLFGFYFGALAVFLITLLLARVIWKRTPGEAVAIGFCAMFSNSLLLGIPIIARAYGETSLTPAFGIVSLHAPFLYAVGMLVMELSRREGRPLPQALRDAARSILANPLMIGIVLGAALNFLGRPLPEFALAAINMFADAAIPVALAGMGAAMTRYSLRSDVSLSLLVCAMSLLVHPALALLVTHCGLGLPVNYVRAAVIMAAMPPGMNGYVFALLYERAVAFSASAILIATTASIVTISLWLLLLEKLLG